MTNLACPICSSRIHIESGVEYLNSSFQFLKQDQDVFQNRSIYFCESCGFGFTHPYIENKQLIDFYNQTYRSSQSEWTFGDRLFPLDEFSYTTRSLSQILLLKTFYDFKPGDYFLDIGGSDGMALHIALQLCPSIRPFAIEPDVHSHPSLKALGIQIISSTFGKEPIPELEGKLFHGILMSHVLEHYNGCDVLDILKHIRKILADESVFLCEVPQEDLKRFLDVRYNDAPHLSFFTKEALIKAFEESGFDVLFVKSASKKIDDWWEDHLNSQNEDKPLRHQKLKNILKKSLPSFIVKKVKRLSHQFTSPSYSELLSHDDFQYGDDRMYLRIVVKKRHSS